MQLIFDIIVEERERDKKIFNLDVNQLTPPMSNDDENKRPLVTNKKHLNVNELSQKEKVTSTTNHQSTILPKLSTPKLILKDHRNSADNIFVETNLVVSDLCHKDIIYWILFKFYLKKFSIRINCNHFKFAKAKFIFSVRSKNCFNFI